MRRMVTRVTQAVVGVLLTSATSAHAQVQLRVDDVRLVEQSSGMWIYNLAVRMTGGPPAANATVDCTLVPGSAKLSDNDYQPLAIGTLTFPAFINGPQYISLRIVGDAINEWNPTLMQDEAFFVEISNPTGPVVIKKDRGTVTLLDDDRVQPGVQFLTAVSGGSASLGQNTLQWRIPAAQTAPTDITIRWNSGAPCVSNTFPPSFTAGTGLNLGIVAGPGQVQSWTHVNLPLGVPHCYSVFAIYGGPSAEIGQVKAKPFNSTGTVAWTYSTGVTGAASVVPPTVGATAIYTVDNRGVVHAMERNLLSPKRGEWPSLWNPVAVGKPTQNRAPLVPISGGGDWTLFLGTDGGGVHAVDAVDGRVRWSRTSFFGTAALPSLGGVQAQPAGLFKAFGGNNDMLLVGTNNSAGNNSFVALDPANGNDLAIYPDPLMGTVKGMASVDYAQPNRVYFVTSSPTATFFALDLGPIGTPSLTLAPEVWNRKAMGGTNGAAVLRGGRVYLGDAAGEVHALHITGGTAGVSYSMPTGDGEVKGFMWPDRRANNRLYFSTVNQVHAVRDDDTAFAPIWAVPLSAGAKPSVLLQRPGTDELYVGDDTGRLVRLDANSGAEMSSVPLEPGVVIGAPSLDNVQGLIFVGSDSGVIYAVRLPF